MLGRLLPSGFGMLRRHFDGFLWIAAAVFGVWIAITPARAADKVGSFNVAGSAQNTTSALGSAITTTTQVLGLSGASLSYYLTDVTVSCGATASAVSLTSSTTAGNACVTSPANVVPAINLPINGSLHMSFRTPIKVTANSALCCKTGGSTAFSCLVSGYIAP